MMMFNVHVPVKSEGAVAVGCSDLLGNIVMATFLVAFDETHMH